MAGLLRAARLGRPHGGPARRAAPARRTGVLRTRRRRGRRTRRRGPLGRRPAAHPAAPSRPGARGRAGGGAGRRHLDVRSRDARLTAGRLAAGRPRPAQPPHHEDRGARHRAGGGGRAGPGLADRPRPEVRPAHVRPAQDAEHRRAAASAWRGHLRLLSRAAAARGLPGHQPNRRGRQHDRDHRLADQRRRGPPAVPGLGQRRGQLAPRAGPGTRWRSGRARPSRDAAGRRTGRLGRGRPAGHLDQPDRLDLDPRGYPRDHPATARRLGSG